MCLTSRHRISRKAARDIKAWKVVLNDRRGDSWRAPFYPMFAYKKDNRCDEFLNAAHWDERVAGYLWTFRINKGFHTYDNKKDAESTANWFNGKDRPRKLVANVVEAVIPKGSRYYQGMDNDYCSEYLHFPSFPF